MKKSPIRCKECRGTNLEPLSDCRWSEERGEWEIKWVQTSEGYCRECDSTVEYEDATTLNKVPKEFLVEAKERWIFKVEAENATEAFAKVEDLAGHYRHEFLDMCDFTVVKETDLTNKAD